jgi:hypothetical protein
MTHIQYEGWLQMNTQGTPTRIKMRTLHTLTASIAATSFLLSAGCNSAQQASPQVVFAGPDLAFVELVEAARGDVNGAFGALFGPDADLVLGASDPVAAQDSLDTFIALWEEQHRAVQGDDGSYTLIVGNNDWPFPIPVVQGADGWSFHMDRGLDEIVDRRIGRNELSAIDVCRAVGDAQVEYRALAPAGEGIYASKFFSDPGMKNGLHWETDANSAVSPLGTLIATAANEGYELGEDGKPTPYHGYHYALLTEQGPSAKGGAKSYVVEGRMTDGFAVVAWPAEYGESGVMTFLMDRRGIVFESDLGPDTAEIAAAMQAYDPDSTWKVCPD